ncbi:MAG: hypothetical protein V4671_33010 [Armatimonadota bacterium]
MSRISNRLVSVETDPVTGEPLRVEGVPVRRVLDHWREWIGILQGESERDLWRLETPLGICEVHLLRPSHWLLARWED